MARSDQEFFAGLRAGARRLARGHDAGATATPAGELAFVWNTLTDRILWSGDAAALFGDGAPSIALAAHLHARINPQDVPARLAALHEALLSRSVFTSQFRLRQADGSFRRIRETGAVEVAGDGAILARGLWRVADRLDLALPREVSPAAPASLARACTAAGAQARGFLVAAAVDHLDVIAQAFGETLAAQIAEIALARCLAAGEADAASLVRLGHGLFAFVLAGDEATLDALRAAVRNETVETPLGHFHVSLSLGAAPLEAARDVGWLLTAAEAALTQARVTGRDRCVVAAPRVGSTDAARSLVLRAEQVLSALRTARAFFAYQPVVDERGRAVFHECLLRLREDDGTLLPAGAFIPAVEALGLHAAVDAYVIARVLEDLAAHADVHLSCNVSSLSLADAAFRARAEAAIAAAPRQAVRLIIEITETAALPDDAAIVAFLARLRSLGVRLALDDFGAGFTSLRHFTALPLDIVKLDGSLVRAMGENERGAAVLHSVVALASQLGLTTVAEGIEYGAEAEALRRLGVRYLQGYHCGRPTVEPAWRIENAGRAASVA
jgi:EAL domain-containing protein (putative c-di-GMP-specific phosphodiesterase class I)/GGDEF domain-containing protein